MIACLGTLVQGQIAGFADHLETRGLTRGSSESYTRERLRLNVQIKYHLLRGFYSGELVQETVSKPGLYWNNRETYLDIFLPRMDLRIGKQKVEWGLIEGWFLTDHINPRDLRYSYTQPLDDIRVGVPMIRVRSFLGRLTLEGLWIPWYQRDPIVKHGPWAPPDNRWLDDQWTLHFLKDSWEDANLTNEFGGRLAGGIGRLEYRLMWFSGYQDDFYPTYTQTTWTPSPGDPDAMADIQTEWRTKRQTTGGLDATYPLGPLMLKTEVSVESPFVFSLIPYFADDKIDQLDYSVDQATTRRTNSMLGVEYFGPFGITLNGQLLQRGFSNYQPSQSQPQLERQAIFTVTAFVPGIDIQVNYWTISDLVESGGANRLEILYRHGLGIVGIVGFHTVWGKSSKLWQPYTSNDYYFASLRYYFG